MQKKYYFWLIPIVLLIIIIYFVNQARNDIAFEFNSNRKFSYTKEDYDEKDYMIVDIFNATHNDLDHTIIEDFYQSVTSHQRSVFNYTLFDCANTRTIKNVYFDGEDILMNESEVSYVGDVRKTREYSCSNQIIFENTDDVTRLKLVDCQLDFSSDTFELRNQTGTIDQVGVYEVSIDLNASFDPF